MKVTKKDFVIKGLDASDANLVIGGSGHFIDNVVSAWYQLDTIELTPLRARISFSPAPNLPDQLKLDTEYSITVSPHGAFSLVAGEAVVDEKLTTIRYIIMGCELIDGRLMFCYTVLEKQLALQKEPKLSCIGATRERLMLDGFVVVDEGTNSARHNIIDIGVA